MDEPDVLDAGPADGGDTNHRPLTNQNPYVFVAGFYSAIGFLETYGWFIILGSIFALVVWTNIRDPLKKMFGGRKRAYDMTDSMSPQQIEARMEGMDRARQRMQEKYDAEAQARAEKLKEREEQKRDQKICDHDALKSGKSQSSTQHKIELKSDTNSVPTVIKRNRDAKPLRSDDYSPLGGGSSQGSTRWRPAPNRPSSGG